MAAKISVIIVTFNNEETIKGCLASIKDNDPEVEIVVVDNKSSDQTLRKVREMGEVRVIESPKNLGFAKGVNRGATEATGEYLVILNPDTKLKTKDGLAKLVEWLKDNPNYGIIGPRFVNPNGSPQPSTRNFPTIANALKEYILGIKGSYDFYQPKCDNLCQVETVYGACFVLSKSLFKQLGGLDEKFFLYYEEIDLCNRIDQLGLKVGFATKVEVEHLVGHSGKGQKTSDLLVESAKKYHGKISYFLIQLIIRVSRYVHL